jgi:glycosyltransferase involved in cell wall biosynthesis
MNILMLFSHPWKFGGAETYLLTLSKGLVERGHKVVIVTDNTVNADLNGYGITHYSLIFRSKNPAAFFLTYKKLRKIIQKHNIDIIHAHQRTAGYFAFALSRSTHKPFLVTLHDLWHRTPLKSVHGKIFTNVIAVSEYIKNNFISKFCAEPSHVVTIYNGVDASGFQDEGQLRKDAEQLRLSMGVEPEEKIITLIGRVTWQKGCFDLVKAASCIQKEFNNFRILIVGDGTDIDELKNYVEDKS